MFNYNHIQAIFIGLFIRIVEGNLKKANELLAKAKFNGPVWEMPGLAIWLSLSEDGKIYSLIIEALGTKQHFKLSKNPTINKRVLNEMKVWYHKYGRKYHDDAHNYIDSQIDKLDIRPVITKIPVLQRLLNTQQEHVLKYSSSLLNEIMPTRVVIRRNIFNKLTVFVDVSTATIKGPMSELFPVHFGVMRSYEASMAKDPVNYWLREALREHAEQNLRLGVAV